MKSKKSVVVVVTVCFLFQIFGCSSEPTTKEECIRENIRGVENKNAVKAIEKSCSEIFDNNETDDDYYKCVLKEVVKAETDKEVNSVFRKCRMSVY